MAAAQREHGRAKRAGLPEHFWCYGILQEISRYVDVRRLDHWQLPAFSIARPRIVGSGTPSIKPPSVHARRGRGPQRVRYAPRNVPVGSSAHGANSPTKKGGASALPSFSWECRAFELVHPNAALNCVDDRVRAAVLQVDLGGRHLNVVHVGVHAQGRRSARLRPVELD